MLKFKIRTRLLLAFLIMVLFSSLAGITGIVLLTYTNQTYSDTLIDYGFAQGYLGKLSEKFQAHRASVLYVISAESQEERIQFNKQLEADLAAIDADMAALSSSIRMDSDRMVFEDLQAQMDVYKGYRDQAVKLADSSPTEAMRMFHKECAPRAAKIADTVNQLLADKSAEGSALSIQLASQSNIFIFIMAGVIILSVFITVVVALKITRSITRPLDELTGAARNLARGDLKVDILYDADDEIGEVSSHMRQTVSALRTYIGEISRLLEELSGGRLDIRIEAEFLGDFVEIDSSLRRTFDKLNHTLAQINLSADQVSNGSDQVSSGAQALSQGATEQASSVQELASAISEISQQVRETASNASSARQQTDAASIRMDACNGQMRDMIEAILEISQKSNEIGKIMKTIQDIAFQTDILALNAAVEAARAGAAGKGFAVVADEVRNLASKSAEASKNTSALIESSIYAIEKGTHLATETAQSLVEVVESAKQVSGVVTQITEATANQANSIVQVTQGVDQISTVVQTNSATAEESAAASEQLFGQAQILKNLVGQFKLKEDGSLYPRPRARQEPF